MSSFRTRSRVLRRAATPLTAAALVLGVSAAVTTPAAASGTYHGGAYVNGFGSMTDGDWNNEGVVNVSTHRNSNVACLWQTVLWADGYMSASDIDGIFGDQTHAATVRWQRDRGLVADGSAGRNTWTKAGQRLNNSNPERSPDGFWYGGYGGKNTSFMVRSSSAGNWGFAEPGSSIRWATYNTRTCS
ncbi:peptidoglycan-binding domain-containing protein [Streptomyces sp. 4N124]|uniref:peptidoglycan-binding domain-containing protein n=1 Tax=Streptomyces sp. 4N124 TaxID=3457420 RepID=UPI003FD1D234